ncbi:RraA family protein [Streptomyces werraensis]|uniref:Putative 4-hydroxy-4-methyl-2-oxoglutarate aldolase n=1 Tax=Streptomyces werraensis TaxID=68284 RepID=A0ABV3JP49_9ACTN
MDDQAIAARLGRVPTASVSDALDRLGLPGSLLGIQRQTTDASVAGRAFTVRYEPVGEGGDGTVGDFLDEVRPGEVVVVDNGGRTDCTVWGGIMARVAAGRGIAGTVINGACRDVAAAESAKYPIWAVSRFMRTGKDRVRCAAVQGTVTIEGVRIAPGDYVHADADGVVAIPSEHIEEVLDLAEEIERVEHEIVAAVLDGAQLAEARRQFAYHTLQRRSV